MSIFDRVMSRQQTDSQKYDLREKVFRNEKVTPLWVADMDLTSPPFVIDALYKRLDHTILGYTTNSDALKASVCWWLKEVHELMVSPKELIFSPSVMTSLAATLEAFTKVGDTLLVLSPVYGGFYEVAKECGREILEVPLLVEEGEYEVDQAKVAELFEEKKIAMLLLCNPQNPSGRVWDEKTLRNLLNMCLCYNVKIFSDEIHSDLVFPPAKHIPLMSLPGAEEAVITAHSIGKTFNLSGLKSSYVYAKDRKLFRQLLKGFQRNDSDGVNLMGKVAMEAVYSWRGQNYRRDLIYYLRKNIAAVKEAIIPYYPKVKAMMPEAGYLIWFDFTESGLSHQEVKQRLINDALLGLTDGNFFGAGGKKHFRMNIAIPKIMLDDVLKRFTTFLAAL